MKGIKEIYSDEQIEEAKKEISSFSEQKMTLIQHLLNNVVDVQYYERQSEIKENADRIENDDEEEMLDSNIKMDDEEEQEENELYNEEENGEYDEYGQEESEIYDEVEQNEYDEVEDEDFEENKELENYDEDIEDDEEDEDREYIEYDMDSDENMEQLKKESDNSQVIIDVAINDEETVNNIIASLKKGDDNKSSLYSIYCRTYNTAALAKILEYTLYYDENNKLLDYINNGLKTMEYRDFMYVCCGLTEIEFLLNEPKFYNAIKNQINNMTNPQFAYFLIAINDKISDCDAPILELIEDKVAELNSPLVNECYELITNGDGTLENEDTKYMDKVGMLYGNQFNKNEILSGLSKKEFLRYSLLNRNFLCYDKEIEDDENKTIIKQLKKLSREDFLAILEDIYPEIEKLDDNYLELIKNDTFVRGVDTLYSRYVYDIIKEARKRNLISNELEKFYSEEEESKAQKTIELYKKINECNDIYMGQDVENNIEYAVFDFIIIRADDEYQQRLDEDDSFELDEEEEDNILIERYKYANQQSEEIMKMYDGLEQLSTADDKALCDTINDFNKKSSNRTVILNEKNNCLINYMKKRIISMPIKNVSLGYLKEAPNGIFNDVIEQKAEEIEPLCIDEL